MSKPLTYTIAIAALLASASASASSQYPGLEKYVYPGNSPASAPEMTFMPGNTTYAVLSDDGKRILLKDIATGNDAGVLLDIDNTREAKINAIESFIVSPDGGKVMVRTSTTPIYRRSVKGSHYVYEVRSRILRPLSEIHKTQQSPIFSPDSRMVAFVDSCNIFVKKLDYNTEVAVTRDGAPGKVINGVPDWTYEEEFSTTCSMAWSPDSQTLSYLRYDEEKVPMYTLPIYAGVCDSRAEYELYPGSFSYKYPVAGEPNSTVTLRSYSIDNRKDWAVPLSDSRIEYIPRIAYGPTSDRLMVVTLNRDQNRMEIFSVNPRSTVSSSILVEENKKAWLDPATYSDIAWLPESFVILSSRTGYLHLYEYSYQGALLSTVTSGEWDVTSFCGYDTKRQLWWIQSTKGGPENRVLSKIDRKGKITDVGPADATASARFTPDMERMVMTVSSSSEAPVVTLRNTDGKVLRTLVDNKAYAAAYADAPRREFFRINANGSELCAMVVKPAGFDPSKSYPLILNQYSGPGSQEVLNIWRPDWTLYFAQKGYVVLTVDPHGTGGRGRDFMDVVYRNLGQRETADLCAAVRTFCADNSWADSSRIAVFGWSFGGYEALMCATEPSNPFKAAVAVAPVTSWRLYDTAYTERYMLTPGQNPEGYRRSAPLERVSGLSSRLLMMWGTADDNVHPANSLEFISALEAQGKWADMLVFPNENHLIKGCGLREVVYARMLSFLDDTL